MIKLNCRLICFTDKKNWGCGVLLFHGDKKAKHYSLESEEAILWWMLDTIIRYWFYVFNNIGNVFFIIKLKPSQSSKSFLNFDRMSLRSDSEISPTFPMNRLLSKDLTWSNITSEFIFFFHKNVEYNTIFVYIPFKIQQSKSNIKINDQFQPLHQQPPRNPCW
jgi:hypothetical protein